MPLQASSARQSVVHGWSNQISDSIGFAKSIGDQRADCVQRGALIGPTGAQYQFTADRRLQSKYRHDAFAVGFLASLLQGDVTGKTLGNIDKLGGGPSVDTETIDDLDLTFGHGVCGSGLLGEVCGCRLSQFAMSYQYVQFTRAKVSAKSFGQIDAPVLPASAPNADRQVGAVVVTKTG